MGGVIRLAPARVENLCLVTAGSRACETPPSQNLMTGASLEASWGQNRGGSHEGRDPAVRSGGPPGFGSPLLDLPHSVADDSMGLRDGGLPSPPAAGQIRSWLRTSGTSATEGVYW